MQRKLGDPLEVPPYGLGTMIVHDERESQWRSRSIFYGAKF